MYYFSIPLPFDKEKIDAFYDINKSINKSKIQTMYNSLPYDVPEFTGFEQPRSDNNNNIKNINDFIDLVIYAKEKGFDFIYLLNSPKVFDIEKNDELEKKFEKLDYLVNTLKKYGVDKYRIANTQLIYYFLKHYPDLKVYLSITLNYYSIKQMENMILSFNNIKEIIPTFEENRNFELLKNLRKKFKNVDIELMVNEGCISGCPFRVAHLTSLLPKNEMQQKDKLKIEYIDFYTETCHDISKKNYWKYLCTSTVIYPWQIEEYAKIGINKFKFVGRETILFQKKGFIDFTKYYLQAIDDPSSADLIPHNIFSVFLWYKNSSILMKDVKPYLPSIEYFKKNGVYCSSRCSVSCNYCYNCAEKLYKKFGDKT